MSEPKRCPRRIAGSTWLHGQIVPSGEFLSCIQEKCAWWVEETRPIKEWDKLRSEGKAIGGHCVALDWGKPYKEEGE